MSYGNYGFVQAKSSLAHLSAGYRVCGKIILCRHTTRRHRIQRGHKRHVNDLNNIGFRGQLLFAPSDKTEITLSGDASRQRPNGYAQVIAGVVPTLTAPYRQFEQIIADLNYELPSRNPFDRKIDHDTPWRSNQDFGGASLNINIELEHGTLTSTTAWRYWILGIPPMTGTSPDCRFWRCHKLRGKRRSMVAGDPIRRNAIFQVKRCLWCIRYCPGPEIKHLTIPKNSGSDQWRFSQHSTGDLWQTPGLLDGYGIKTNLQTQYLQRRRFWSGRIWTITDTPAVFCRA